MDHSGLLRRLVFFDRYMLFSKVRSNQFIMTNISFLISVNSKVVLYGLNNRIFRSIVVWYSSAFHKCCKWGRSQKRWKGVLSSVLHKWQNFPLTIENLESFSFIFTNMQSCVINSNSWSRIHFYQLHFVS